MKSATIIFVSDEILHNGEDHNVRFLVNQLNLLNCDIKKVLIIPEHVNVISHEIKEAVRVTDLNIIVGILKNGLVYKALSKITSQDLLKNSDMETCLKETKKDYCENEIFIPALAKILCNNKKFYPVVHLQRIFILNYGNLAESFLNNLNPYLTYSTKDIIFTKIIEIPKSNTCNITNLDKFIENNGIKVELNDTDQYLRFKVSSRLVSYIVNFERKLKLKFENSQMVSREDSALYEDIYSSAEHHIKSAIENIECCLEKYGPENIFVSFNGGKDCTVLLHLILVVLRKKFSNYTQSLLCLYVQNENPFLEQNEFISQCERYYNLKIMTIQSGIKDALQEILLKYQNYKACFMGTRKTDPYSRNLNTFQMTDPNWPQIMRVSPLLNWSYYDIWDYLLYYQIPYCDLYDMGYTSLGNTVNTVRNNCLLYYNIFEEKEMYLPAYKLLNESEERNGRS